MFGLPDHNHNLSMRLSEVMDDIGVNKRIVMKRRQSRLLRETIIHFSNRINGIDESIFNFGSQSEGSTTLGLQSDIDYLYCLGGFQIIQYRSEWQIQPVKENLLQLQYDNVQLLMVQDETKSPGYCLLQLLRNDVFLPVEDIQHEHFIRDSRGRILMKHSMLVCLQEGRIRNGPARAQQGVPGVVDNDVVSAFFCSSWPKEAEPWLQQKNISGWPTEDMKRYAAEHGCFVVPVASRESPNQDTEWRISTSYAERCLMFSINMTQIRCYILMKMILKTFFKPRCEDVISSFMCKNVLFHCIANSSANAWTDSNLIPRLNQCLHALCNCIFTENCPHFIIPGNNLLGGKLSIPAKEQLLEIMGNLTGNLEQSLLGISIDQLGDRLIVKSGGRILASRLPSPELNSGEVVSSLIINNTELLKSIQYLTQKNIYHNRSESVYQSLIQVISALCQIYSVGSKMEQVACRYYTPFFCASLGSIAASIGIYYFGAIPPVALMWFSAGLNSDLSSSMLKLATFQYSVGQNEQCETILAELSSLLEVTPILRICCCYAKEKIIPQEFAILCNEKNEEDVIKQNIAFCVTFLPCEIYCVPKELRYEFFRSTEEDRALRGERDFWMDWAVVDSLTFLHFMEYKVNTQLQRSVEQHRALDNLVRTINIIPYLGHRETALNLLGQCMEQEKKLNAALCCYMMSLNVRRINNAAQWHVCRLFARLFRHRQ